MKSVLVIDMPPTCYDCPLAMYLYEPLATSKKHKEFKKYKDNMLACVLTDTAITSTKRRRFCPLKEMPNKMISEMVMGNSYAEGIVKGWNDCLEEIEK